jgi:hypothetical protein
VKRALNLLSLLLLAGCAGGGEPEGLQPNFVGDGYSLNAQQTSLNTYKFTVVENTKHRNIVFSVFGFHDQSQITPTFNMNSHARLSHVSDVKNAGDSFEITFNDDDTWFAIYQDDWDGLSWIYSDRVELIRGDFR